MEVTLQEGAEKQDDRNKYRRARNRDAGRKAGRVLGGIQAV
jgi:hypothetical protein